MHSRAQRMEPKNVYWFHLESHPRILERETDSRASKNVLSKKGRLNSNWEMCFHLVVTMVEIHTIVNVKSLQLHAVHSETKLS